MSSLISTQTARLILTGIFLLKLTACKDHEPNPTCKETIKIFEYKGHRVMQTPNGVHLKEYFPFAGCKGTPYTKDPYQRHFVTHGYERYYWRNNHLYTMPEYGSLRQAGQWPEIESIIIQVYIEISDRAIGIKQKPKPNWWYQPAIPHQRYPIALLPNFGLSTPDPNAGVGPVKSKPTVYWAVRGTKDSDTQQPFSTFCGMQSPPEWNKKDYSPEATKERDPQWLIQAKTYSTYIGNTCRGGVSADNGKPIGAMIDVPGMGVPDIDKIYQAISRRLSEFIVE